MFKFLFFFQIFLLIQIIICVNYYATRYDHIDVEAILNNRRMVNYYAACLLNQGPCPPQGVELKRILPEALQTNCARCTEKQKTVAYRSIKRLKKEYPKIWNELSDLWDPDGSYIEKFENIFQNKTPIPNQLFNRFGDDNDEAETSNSLTTKDNNNSITSNTISTTSSSVTRSVTKSSTGTTSTSTTSKIITTPSTSSSNTNTLSTSKHTNYIPIKTPTNKPTFININNHNYHHKFSIKPLRTPSIEAVGANIQATVSFGSNIVDGFVRGLGEIGDKVVQTGTKFAEGVLSAFIPQSIKY